jgi:hypothetical protein
MNEKTTAVPFDHIPVIDDHLLEVRAGLDVDWVLREAACLDESVQSLLQDAVDGGMDSRTAYLCRFALGAAEALRTAAGVAA